MPIPTPFHSRTAALCESHEWRNWSGYLAASLYEPAAHDREYYAIRNAAALIDVSPLYKYQVSGPDAARLLDRITTRNFSRCAVGQVLYTPWCDDDGKVIDDGTVARLAIDRFRITAAEPNLAWFQDCAMGMDVEVTDISEALAALAVQGPNSRRVLQEILREIRLDAEEPGTNGKLERLKYYRIAPACTADFPLEVSRTGYTGDLGYELWVAPEHAERLWDCLVEAGQGYGISPAGMVALDIARIEAGLLLNPVDYIPARRALIREQKSSPFELGLRWAVDLSKEGFVGRKALLEEKARGSQWSFVGLEVRWEALEKLFGEAGLTPQVAGRASRLAVPVYAGEAHPSAPHTRKMRTRLPQIGQATSHTFSPILKKYIALASLERRHAEIGSRVNFEVTVEYTRVQGEATVVKLPFFNPPRKKA
jgi:aminomethyltransferase